MELTDSIQNISRGLPLTVAIVPSRTRRQYDYSRFGHALPALSPLPIGKKFFFLSLNFPPI